MGLIGFGAVKGMQASEKMNREQLKKRRKSAKEIAARYPEQNQLSKQAIDPAKLASFKQKMERQQAIQKRNKIVAICILGSLVAAAFIAIFWS